MKPLIILKIALYGIMLFIYTVTTNAQTPLVSNDVSQLNPIIIGKIITPQSTSELQKAVRSHSGPICISGGKYSMGGQTAYENALQINLCDFDSILHFSPEENTITVQSGITWREIQEYIDPYNLSVKIMQTYADFTVGGSLSVNVHGRYMGQGPVILSVMHIHLLLANGNCIKASPTENTELFYGAIGGYGGLGIITEVKLQLVPNTKLERTDKTMPITSYKDFFSKNIRKDSLIVFHNADIYPNSYKKVRAISYRTTTRKITVQDRLKPLKKQYKLNQRVIQYIAHGPGGKLLRQYIIEPVLNRNKPVVWRNYEASYHALELEPRSRKKATYVLQEYFVPVDSFETFYPKMCGILKQNKVNVINISIRHSCQDPGTLLSWANSEVFAFVIYYQQGTSIKDQENVRNWTQKLIDAALSSKGSYYLPYQLCAKQEQFIKAYPKAINYQELKRTVDPENKFRNKFLETYLSH